MRSRSYGFLALVAVLALVGGCKTTVVAPPAPRQPAVVYIIDHGRTSSLLLPDVQGGHVRYAYGDWTYYALARRGFLQGATAILLPTRATLGRMAYPAMRDRRDVRHYFGAKAQDLHPVAVEQARANRLKSRLDNQFVRYRLTLVRNEPYDMEFVWHPTPYTGANSSNRMVARWLRELGCEVEGAALFANWTVVH